MKEFMEFNGTKISSMCWNDASSKLFVGNANGLVMSFVVGFTVRIFFSFSIL